MNREISARAADEASAPFVQVSTQDGRPVVAGLQTAFFGHRIPRPDLPTDDGVFAAWRWHDGTLEIESDRYGSGRSSTPLEAVTSSARPQSRRFSPAACSRFSTMRRSRSFSG